MADLKSRPLDDESYSGLIESLGRITLICHVADATRNDLSKDDLVNLLSQIGIIGTEAMILAGATPEEVTAVTHELLSSQEYET